MAIIDKKFIHFKTYNDFISQAGVGSVSNITTPTSGSEANHNAVYGQIKGSSIVFIKDTRQIWTHGQLYSGNVDASELVIERGSSLNSAVLAGEYEGYSNKAISQISMALGAATTAGLKGWYYSNITFGNNPVITLSDKQPSVFLGYLSGGKWSSGTPNIKAGDKVSIVNNAKYDYCGEVKSVSGNKITLKSSLPFDSLDTSLISVNNPDDWSIYLPDKESAGVIDFGGGALAEGVNTKATNIGAHAEGIQTHAYGQYSHTEGFRTEAGYAAHAEGRSSIASGQSSHAEGNGNTASGNASHAEGDSTTASGKLAHAEGNTTVASGEASHAEGYQTEATNNQSHAEGGSTRATGKQSHAEGWSTTASGDHSHAEGGYTTASGKQSHVGGNNSIANGARSFAHGNHVETSNADEVAFGKYNASGEDTIFSIGNGTSETERNNAFEVKADNTAYVNGNQIATLNHIPAPITVDTELNSNSNNPIANSVVTNAIRGGVHFRGVYNSLPAEFDDVYGSEYVDASWLETDEEVGGIIEVLRKRFYEGDIIIISPYYDGSLDTKFDVVSSETTEYILVYESDDTTQDDGQWKWVELGDVTPAQDMINESLKNYYKKNEVYNKSESDGKYQLKGDYATQAQVSTALAKKANVSDVYTKDQTDETINQKISTFAKKADLVVEQGDKDNSVVLKGEYNGYSNKAISQVSASLGAASTAGLKGWYYTKVNFSTNSIWLSNERDTNKLLGIPYEIKVSETTSTTPDNASFVSGWKAYIYNGDGSVKEQGDEVTIVNDKKYERCAKIIAINGNMITLDKLPFDKDSIVKTSPSIDIGGVKYNEPDEFSITALRVEDDDTFKTRTVSSYDKGNVDFGGGSHAEGIQTYAINIGAHAEGIQSVAYGQYSHAEGFRTEAAYTAHAEGRNTTASGQGSHSEGSDTIASGNAAHAEGKSTTASGQYSHAEGFSSTSSGDHSHSEGYNTNATNNQAHAEGGSTTASGKQSHSEGWSTLADGDHSHAEGGYTKALGKQSHAGGNNAIAEGTRSFAHGSYVTAKNADEVVFGKYNNTNIEDNLFSIGNGTSENARHNVFEVKAAGAFVNGQLVAVQNQVDLKADKATTYTKDETTTVINNAFNEFATKISNDATINTYKELIDYANTHGPEFTTLVGEVGKKANKTEIPVQYTTSEEGSGIISKGNGVHAVGDAAIALGSSDIKNYEGTDYKADWLAARGITDVSLGSTTQTGYLFAVGNQSIALGRSCLAAGAQSFAAGMMNASLGVHSVALGGYSIANCRDSVAAGYGCVTTVVSSTDGGRGEFACGKFNKSNPNTIFSVGIGTGTSLDKRKNALEITTDGKVYVGDASLGKEVVTTDTMSSAVSNKADKATTLSGYGITDAYTSAQVETRLATLGLLDAASLVEITYADLVELRNNNTLMPGRFYRIVDYITTTTQENTASAGYQFDIIVLATSTNTLSEEAWAVQHDFDQEENNVNLCQLEDNDDGAGVYNLKTPKTVNVTSLLLTDVPYFIVPDGAPLPLTRFISDKITLKSINNEGVLSFTSEYFNADIEGDVYTVFRTPVFKKASLTNGGGFDIAIHSVYLPNIDVDYSKLWSDNQICIDGVTGYLYKVTVNKSSLVKYALISNTSDIDSIACLLFNDFPTEAIPNYCVSATHTYTYLTLHFSEVSSGSRFATFSYSYELESLKQIGRGQQALMTSDSKPATYNNLKSELESHFEDSKLNVWNIKYCLDNDSRRFAWADTTNGKGVVYRMIDEFGNDCPYDFKNILYKVPFPTPVGGGYECHWYYTFTDSNINPSEMDSHDASVGRLDCYSNKIYQNKFPSRLIPNFFKSGEDGILSNNVLLENCENCKICEASQCKFANCEECSINIANLINLYNCKHVVIGDSANSIVGYFTHGANDEPYYILGETDLFIIGGNILANNVYQSNQ